MTEPFQLPFAPVYSSQRSGEVSLESAMWRGEERRFAVQWHEDRAYFRLHDGNLGVWASLDSCEENDVVACFEEAVRSLRYGVCFSRHWEVYRRNFVMCLQFIFAPDGTGLLREWSSRDWLAFAPEETRAWALFPDVVLLFEGKQLGFSLEARGCCHAAVHCVENQLLMRRVSDEEIERLSFHTNRNQTEFEQIARLLWGARLIRPATSSRWTSVNLFTYAPKLQSTIEFINPNWSGSPALLNWLQFYFTMQGFEWRDNKWGRHRFRKLRKSEPCLRAWRNPFSVCWSVSFLGGDEPTAHEQLEARLELHDWLREKAPDAPIESWLTPQT